MNVMKMRDAGPSSSSYRADVQPLSGARAEEQAPTSARLGEIIDGKYEIVRDLGRGAAGVVFEAKHIFTGRSVALKMVLPQGSAAHSKDLEERLLREARALTIARHPSIVDILDAGVSDKGPYIALELLQGRTLEGILAARGKISSQDAVGLALQLCSALDAAHAADVVHRDLKPSNVIIVRDAHGLERIKLVDFGIAQVRAPRDRKLTGLGALIGTPEYMAPEQLLALDDIDARADVYALGVMLFECLTGQVPYAGEYPMVLLSVTRPGPAPSVIPLCPTLDEALANVVEKAMAKRREDRFQSAAEFGRAIRAAVNGARPNTALLTPARRSANQPPPLPKAAATPTAPQAANSNESRRAARAPYCTPVAILTPDGKRWEGRNEDISAGGMLLVSNAQCVAGQKLRVRFATPVDGRLVTCTADVRWVRDARAGDQSGLRAIGLSFTDATPQMVASIESFVEFMTDANLA